MIRHLHVEGYRSIRNLHLDLGEANVVLGPNGSGKTNLYRALYLLAEAAHGRFARALADEGGMPSALWAGARRKGPPVQMIVGATIDSFSYELACGLPQKGSLMWEGHGKPSRFRHPRRLLIVGPAREPRCGSGVLPAMHVGSDRRTFLVWASASAGAFAGGCAARAAKPTSRSAPQARFATADRICSWVPALRAGPTGRSAGRSIVVVGGGLAGLVVAHTLTRRGHDVRLLEATDRAGGRILTIRAPWRDGLIVEAGAEHVVGDPALLELCASMGVGVEKRAKARGLAQVSFIAGTRAVAPAGAALAPVHALRADETALTVEQRMAKYFPDVGSFDPTAPLPPSLLPLDAMTGGELLRRRGASAGFLAEIDGMLGLGDSGIEGMSALAMVQAWAEIRREIALGGGGRIAGGCDRLPAAIAARLGGRIIHGAEVTGIDQTAGLARVTFRRRDQQSVLEADRVVVAIPAPVLARLTVVPALSADKRAALGELELESVTRVWLQADQRFWIARGEAGRARTDFATGPVRDETEGLPGTAGILGVYATRAGSRQLARLSDGDRVAALLASVDRVHPGLRDHFVAGASKCWDTDPFQCGAYAFFKPGQLTRLAPHLGRAEGRIHFAGDHTSHRPGFMHGALASAHRVLAELAEA
jgi:monoamine oxidase